MKGKTLDDAMRLLVPDDQSKADDSSVEDDDFGEVDATCNVCVRIMGGESLNKKHACSNRRLCAGTNVRKNEPCKSFTPLPTLKFCKQHRKKGNESHPYDEPKKPSPKRSLEDGDDDSDDDSDDVVYKPASKKKVQFTLTPAVAQKAVVVKPAVVKPAVAQPAVAQPAVAQPAVALTASQPAVPAVGVASQVMQAQLAMFDLIGTRPEMFSAASVEMLIQIQLRALEME